jgi:thiaminase/transcriptional activator TenA
MAPTTRAYTDFLLRVATTGDFADLVAALLPCMWGFSEIGQRLAAGPQPSNHPYAAWIEAYASPDFAQLAEWCRHLLDRLAGEVGEQGRRRMQEAFLTSSRYELAFWEAAWSQQRHWAGSG